MEKNQHPHNATISGGKNDSGFTGNQPGQQLPTGQEAENLNEPITPEEDVQHSASSFPKQEGETLGTP